MRRRSRYTRGPEEDRKPNTRVVLMLRTNTDNPEDLERSISKAITRQLLKTSTVIEITSIQIENQKGH